MSGRSKRGGGGGGGTIGDAAGALPVDSISASPFGGGGGGGGVSSNGDSIDLKRKIFATPQGEYTQQQCVVKKSHIQFGVGGTKIAYGIKSTNPNDKHPMCVYGRDNETFSEDQYALIELQYWYNKNQDYIKNAVKEFFGSILLSHKYPKSTIPTHVCFIFYDFKSTTHGISFDINIITQLMSENDNSLENIFNTIMQKFNLTHGQEIKLTHVCLLQTRAYELNDMHNNDNESQTAVRDFCDNLDICVADLKTSNLMAKFLRNDNNIAKYKIVLVDLDPDYLKDVTTLSNFFKYDCASGVREYTFLILCCYNYIFKHFYNFTFSKLFNFVDINIIYNSMCNDDLIKFLICYLDMLIVDSEEDKQIIPNPNKSIFYTLCRYFGINELDERFNSNAEFYEKFKSTMVGHLNSAIYEEFDEMDDDDNDDMNSDIDDDDNDNNMNSDIDDDDNDNNMNSAIDDDDMNSAINKEFNEIMTINLEGHNRSKLIQHFRNIATTLHKSKIESFVIIYHFFDYILLLLENEVDEYFDVETYKRIENYFNQIKYLKNARESGIKTLGQGTRVGPEKFHEIISRHKNGVSPNAKGYYKRSEKKKIVDKNTHKKKKINKKTRKEDEYSGGKRRRRKTYKKSRRKNSKKTRRK